MARKIKDVTISLSGAVSDAFSEIESLKDELQEWYDNLPEQFQNGSKGEALQEAIGGLEQDTEPEVPSEVDSFDVVYTPILKRRLSRADRCSNAVSMLTAAKDYVEN